MRACICTPPSPARAWARSRRWRPGSSPFASSSRAERPTPPSRVTPAFAHLAVNPVASATLLCQALARLDAERGARVHHPALDAAIGRSTNLLVAHIAAGTPQRLNRVPTTCTIGATLSFPPPETLGAVQAEIAAAIDAACAADAFLSAHRPTILWDSGVTGAEVAPEAPLYRIAAEAIEAVTGQPAHVNALHTSSDIRNPINQAGIPTIGLGPLCGDLSQNGRTDEWVDVADFLRSVRVATGIIERWCRDRP